MDTQSTDLTIEQQFQMTLYKEVIKDMSLKDARKYLLDLLEQDMIKSNIIKQWMKTGF